MELNQAMAHELEVAGIALARRGPMLAVSLERPDQGNTLNAAMIGGLHRVLDLYGQDDALRMLTIRGRDGVFCDGMDFAEAVDTSVASAEALRGRIAPFWHLLARFGETSKIVVALVDGRVSAGGVGLAAASDLVFATPRSSFVLTELMFGLVPATIAPFLIRRIGWQAAYRMTLTARGVPASEARSMNLADEITDDLDDAARRLLVKVARMDTGAVGETKRYFRALEPFAPETERQALDLICARIADPEVIKGIRRFVAGEGLPWSRS